MKRMTVCMAFAAMVLSATAAEPRLRTLDMVHHNPGEKPTQSKFLEPAYLAAMGSGAKVVNDFQAPQCACTFDELDPTIFPAGSESRKWVEDFTASCETRARACHAVGIKDHNSIDPMPGMDAEVDRYRKMVESK